ncbi:MAG: hypothetical protein CMF59_15195 [Leptospiraceae bacterium]|nr:hypothetical protein [Leptospiraceae bacterium]
MPEVLQHWLDPAELEISEGQLKGDSMIPHFRRKFSDFATSTPWAARRASQRAIRTANCKAAVFYGGCKQPHRFTRPEGPHKFAREQFLQEGQLKGDNMVPNFRRKFSDFTTSTTGESKTLRDHDDRQRRSRAEFSWEARYRRVN